MTTLFRKILVPHDFSPAASAALETAVELAAEHGGELIVLHAMAPVYPLTSFGADDELPAWMPAKELVAEARAHLEELVASVRKRRGVRGATCRVLVGDPHRCILRAARDADSIVMGTLGRTGLSHMLIGSVAEKVVRHAPVPVLTVRARKGRRKVLRRAGRSRPARAAR